MKTIKLTDKEVDLLDSLIEFGFSLGFCEDDDSGIINSKAEDMLHEIRSKLTQ